MTTGVVATPVVPETGLSGSSAGDVMEILTYLLKAQADVMTAQAKAVAMQNIPNLACYLERGAMLWTDARAVHS